MSIERKFSACSVFGGRIVVSGGIWTGSDTDEVEVYDHCANEWSQMPNMIESRSDHASISIKNKLFIMHGWSHQCEVFDSFSQKFAYIKTVLPIHKFSVQLAQYVTGGNEIMIFDLPDAVVFDVEQEKWREEKSFDSGRAPFDCFILTLDC